MRPMKRRKAGSAALGYCGRNYAGIRFGARAILSIRLYVAKASIFRGCANDMVSSRGHTALCTYTRVATSVCESPIQRSGACRSSLGSTLSMSGAGGCPGRGVAVSSVAAVGFSDSVLGRVVGLWI